MGRSSRIHSRAAESRRKGPQPAKGEVLKGDQEESPEGKENFVPEDEAFKTALKEWDRVNSEIEGYVNDAGLLDSDDPDQARLIQELDTAYDAIRQSLMALGYGSVRMLINLFFFENNSDPEKYPDGHFDRLSMSIE